MDRGAGQDHRTAHRRTAGRAASQRGRGRAAPAVRGAAAPAVRAWGLRRLLRQRVPRGQRRADIPAGRRAAHAELEAHADRLSRPVGHDRAVRYPGHPPVRPAPRGGSFRPDVRAVPAARLRGRGRLRRRRRLVRAGAGRRLRRARVRRVPAQRLVLARPAGVGIAAARPVPGQVVRHVGLAVGGAARRAGARQGQPAVARPGAAAVPGRRRPVGPGPRARGAAERAGGGAPAVRHHLLDGGADAGPYDRERRVDPHRRPVRLGHGQRPRPGPARLPAGAELGWRRAAHAARRIGAQLPRGRRRGHDQRHRARCRRCQDRLRRGHRPDRGQPLPPDPLP